MNELIAYAERKIHEACCNDDDNATIRYWVGYVDGLRAAQREEQGGEQA